MRRTRTRASVPVTAALLMAWPGAGQACAFGDMVALGTVPNAVWDELAERTRLDTTLLQTAPGEVTAFVADLNGDGAEEICLSLRTNLTCARDAVTCMHYLIDPGPPAFVLFADSNSGIAALDSTTFGWSDLRMTRTTASGPQVAVARFNGQFYDFGDEPRRQP